MRTRFLALATAFAVASTTFLTLHLADSAQACDAAEAYAARKAATARAPDAERADALFQLGVWARDHGFAADAPTHFRHAIGTDPDHAAARDALGHLRHAGKWLNAEEALTARGFVRRDGKWLLTEEAALLDLSATQRETRRAQQDKARDLLAKIGVGDERVQRIARAALDGVDDAHKLEPLAYALRAPQDHVRQLAVQELGRIGNRRAIRPLLHRAVFDPSADVRHAAIDAARTIGDPNLLLPLMRVMEGEDGKRRANAADAIGRLGDVRGVQYLVYKYEARGGGAPRAMFSDISQLSFIQDFDVEVASTAFIADPLVSVIQEGKVLDVQIVATSHVSYLIEREVIHGALSRLTGATDVKNEDGAWAAWYHEHRDRLAQVR